MRKIKESYYFNIMAIRSSLLHEEQKTASNWDKFKLLMWKNCLLQTRHKFRTIFEILIPLILMVLIVLIRRSVSSFGYNPITTFQSFNINELEYVHFIIFYHNKFSEILIYICEIV